MKIIDYATRGGKNLILEYIENLPIALKLISYDIRDKIEEDGLIAFESLDTRQLRKKLYEIRFSNQRIMYVLKDKDVVYFLHMCKKEKGKTRLKDMQTAISRAKELGYKF